MIGSIGPKRVTAVAALCLLRVVGGSRSALLVAALVAVLLTALALWEAVTSPHPRTRRGVRSGARRG